MNSDPNPYVAPQAIPATVSAATAEETEERALKLAGVFLCIGALVNVVAMATVGATAVQATYSGGWMSIVFDLWIGGSLAMGRFRVRSWAMIRAGLGGAMWGGGAIIRGDVAGGVITVALCAAILLLVAPGAGTMRIRIASVLYGIVMLLAVVGLLLPHAN